MAKGNGISKAAAAAGMAERFQEIKTERYMYNADKCGDVPLVGYLVCKEPMNPIDDRPWDAFVIRTTQPTKALDREKNVVEIAVGEEVLIPATNQLAKFMSKAASHSQLAFEVFIKPKSKISLGKGKSMWTYNLGADMKGVSLDSLGIKMLRDPGALKALPAATVEGAADVGF